MSTDLPSGAEPKDAPGTPTHAVPVYNVPAPGEENKPKPKRIEFICIYGHSNLFYWWPVWLVSFVLAGVTYADGHRMTVVPRGSDAAAAKRVEKADGTVVENRDVLIAPPGAQLATNPDDEAHPSRADLAVSRSNNLGVVFVFTLVLVAMFSTLTLRGLVSLVAIVVLIAMVVTFALLGWWDDIFRFVGGLDVRMNAAGYLAVAVPLFLVWCAVTFLYDRQHYIIFDEGQIRYVREVGESEIVMDSGGAIVEKKRDDVFRHWLLGFGSGDLLIRVGGSNGQYIEMENVLNIGRKLVLVNDMLQHKAITTEG